VKVFALFLKACWRKLLGADAGAFGADKMGRGDHSLEVCLVDGVLEVFGWFCHGGDARGPS